MNEDESTREYNDYEFFRVNLECLKKVKEQGTQTEEKVREPDEWKQQVESISDHKTEGNRMGVRFTTKWKGYRIALPERSEIILERGGKKVLTDYLLKLEKRHKNRLHWLLRNEPELAELLAEDEQANMAPAA